MLKLAQEFGVYFCQSKINDRPSLGFGVVQKVARLDVPMVNAEIFQILQAYEQFKDVVLDFLQSEGIEEGLYRMKNTMKDLNLKYCSTMWVMS